MYSIKQETYHQQCVADIIVPDDWEPDGAINDLCPSYINGTYRIFVDHPDPKEREDESYPRFNVTSEDGHNSLFTSDNFDDVKNFVSEKGES